MHNYLADICQDLRTQLVNALAENLQAIIVAGSLSRKEESILKIRDNHRILSDVDLYLVVKQMPAAGLQDQALKITKKIEARVSRDGASSPFFNIQFAIIPQKKVKRLWRNVRHFELAKDGDFLYGTREILNFPRIDENNIDFFMSNGFLIERLRKQLAFTDGSHDTIFKKFFICRNIIEIPTIILPNLKILASGYASRHQIFCTIKGELEDYIPEADMDRLLKIQKYALDIKLKPSVDKLAQWEMDELLDDLVYSYFFTYIFLKRKSNYKNPFFYPLNLRLKLKPAREVLRDGLNFFRKGFGEGELENIFFILLFSCTHNIDLKNDFVSIFKSLTHRK